MTEMNQLGFLDGNVELLLSLHDPTAGLNTPLHFASQHPETPPSHDVELKNLREFAYS
ncbi:hypothetical protein KIN20_032861 [Parelaphostrongylus tenuis]|uniref:Uncharacterized protein n=1 Tax=Parelaphostrongylus tenuis TaxID=148309 RepID=A0AAD5WIE5_PARTN|nr:hypothetical protein KIN20_032861 [Parelaphostrongylus tenuis]